MVLFCILADRSALVDGKSTVLKRGELSDWISRSGFELFRRLLIDPIRKLYIVVEVKFLEEPCCSDAA
jgi:hypothetical protein